MSLRGRQPPDAAPGLRRFSKTPPLSRWRSDDGKLINFVYNVAVVTSNWASATMDGFTPLVSFVGLFGIFTELGISRYVMRLPAIRKRATIFSGI